MPVTRAEKKAVVAHVAEAAARAQSAVAAEYRGLSVAEMTVLRERAREAGLYLRVVRNTLARRALADTDFACMRDGLVGPLILAFSHAEPSASARVMRDFSRQNGKLVIKLVAFGGKLIDPANIDLLARIPTREEALARLLMVMKSPIAALARTLAEPHAKLVRAVGALREQKESAQTSTHAIE